MSVAIKKIGEVKSKVFILGGTIIMVFYLIFMEKRFRTLDIPQNPGQHETSGNKLHEKLFTKKFGKGFDASPPYWSRVTKVCQENNFLNINSTVLTDMSASKVNSFSFHRNGVLMMSIQTYDISNRPKLYGGDAILAWATEENGDGKAAANIVDNSNGTYSVRVLLFWTGLTRVNFKLVSSAETFCNFFPDWSRYGKNASAKKRNEYSLVGLFVNGDTGIQEMTECGPLSRLYMGEEICNFTSLNGGFPWFCIKPKHKTLTCLSVNWFKSGHLHQNISDAIRSNQKILNDQSFRSVSFTAGSHFKRTTELLCKDREPLDSWIESQPSGFWKNDKWYFVNCDSKLKHNILDYRKCLKNKNIYFVGDSTVRQYAGYFLTNILGDKNTDQIFGATNLFHTNKVVSNYNISLMFFRHKMLFQGSHGYPAAGIKSVPHILQYIANSSNDKETLILMVTYNAHFSIYPPEVFRDRTSHLSKSIQILLQMKPKAKIFFKSTYPTYKDLKAFDVKIWMVFQEILLEEFAFIMDRVVLLDIWSIVVAPEEADLHPQEKAFISEIQQFMSYLC